MKFFWFWLVTVGIIATACATTPEEKRRQTLAHLKATRSAPSYAILRVPIDPDEPKLGNQVVWRPCATAQARPDCQIPDNYDEDDHIHKLSDAQFLSQVAIDVGPLTRQLDTAAIDKIQSPYKKHWLKNKLLKEQLETSENLTPLLKPLPPLQQVLPFYQKLGPIVSWKTIPRPDNLFQARRSCQTDSMRILTVNDILPTISPEDRAKILGYNAEFFCRQIPTWILNQLHTSKQAYSTWLGDYLAPDLGVYLFVANKEEPICRIKRGPAEQSRGIVCVL